MPYMTSNRGSVSGLGWFGSDRIKTFSLYYPHASREEQQKAVALGSKTDKQLVIAKAITIMQDMAKTGKSATDIENWYNTKFPTIWKPDLVSSLRMIQAEARIAELEARQAAQPPPAPVPTTQTQVTLQPKAIIPPDTESTTPSAPEPPVATVLPPGATGPTGAPGPVWTPDEAPEPDIAWGTIGFVGMGLAGLGILVYAMTRKKR